MSDGKHVVVIGGGVIGLSCAYYLAQRGYGVSVVERGGPTADNCSFGNAGLVVPSHIIPLAAPGMVMMGLKWMRDPESPFYVKPRLSPDLLSWAWQFYQAGSREHVERSAPLIRDLNMASRAAYEELDEAFGHGFAFEKQGLMMLCKTQHALDEEAHVGEHARRLGMPMEILNANEAAAREPHIEMDILGAAFYPNDCHLSPAAFLKALQAALEKSGAQFHWNTEVTGWRREGKRVAAVNTAQGEIAGDEFVLCGGSWSPNMARALELNLPMQAGKGYSLTVDSPPQQPVHPAILVEGRVAVTPMENTLRFAGTMEIAGLNTDVNPARLRGILKTLPKYYPRYGGYDFSGIQPWVGLRPCSPDGLPYVGRTRRYENLSLATGHAMMGLSLAPITGKLIAQSIAGETPEISSVLLNPDRYR